MKSALRLVVGLTFAGCFASDLAAASKCEMIDDPAGYRYLECDPDRIKAAREAAIEAAAKAGPPKKPGHAQSVEEFKANMEADSAKTDAERAVAMARAAALASEPEKVAGENTRAGTASPAATASCVTSNCGPIHVKGYYRKDGTYVRPHTRKR